MAKKTWVKIKRGFIIDPKHRIALGNRVWLYLYMLDVADWETGKVLEWRDRDAADDLQMPISTIRLQRRQLEDADYISCFQHKTHQTITIKRWINPRDYENKGDYLLIPNGEEQGMSDNKGNNKGDKKGDQKLPPVHNIHIPQITDHPIEKIVKNRDLFKDQSPRSLALTDENGELAPEEDRIIEIFCDRVGLTGNNRPYENDPSNRKWYADWLREAGEIQKLGISSGEMGEAIAILKASGYSCKHPGAIIETVKNMRKDREAFEKGEKKKLHRYKLEKYTDARGNWNYQPIDWWEEK